MGALADPVLLSRLQFTVTAVFHILWPVLSIGLSLFLVAMEVLWLKTGDDDYYRHARFWSKVFLLNFTMGVVSGIPLEFEFGTNWDRFASFAGEFFGNILGFEGAMAFMLEAGFLGIMLFGWGRVTPAIHLFSSCMVALGASLSAFWILVANSWMQTPTGGHVEAGRFRVDSYFDAIFNPDMPLAFAHMWVACLEVSVFVVGGISAWYLLNNRTPAFFLKSFRLALLAAVALTPAQIVIGDAKGHETYKTQPVKLAAIEAHWETNAPGMGASWNVIAWPNSQDEHNDWAIQIPNMLSVLATSESTGHVLGLRSFPVEDRPPAIPLIFYAFRVMAGIGFGLFALVLWTVWILSKGALTLEKVRGHRRLLRAWVIAIPLAYLATECGWIVREVGRQPWVVYGLLRTENAASLLPAASVGASLVSFVVVYLSLLLVFVHFLARILHRGPDLMLAVPLHGRRRRAARRGQAREGKAHDGQ